MLYGLTGPITVRGRTYNGVMPNQGNVMKDYEIAGVLTYVRNSWCNKADPGKPPAITAAVVRAARAKEGPAQDQRHAPVSQAELLDPAWTTPTRATARRTEGEDEKKDDEESQSRKSATG